MIRLSTTACSRSAPRKSFTGFVRAEGEPGFQGLTSDLSASGLQLLSNRLWKPGTKLSIGMNYGSGELRGVAVVKWTKSDSFIRSGLHFVDLDEEGCLALRDALTIEESTVQNIRNLVAATDLSGECRAPSSIAEFYKQGCTYQLRVFFGSNRPLTTCRIPAPALSLSTV